MGKAWGCRLRLHVNSGFGHRSGACSAWRSGLMDSQTGVAALPHPRCAHAQGSIDGHTELVVLPSEAHQPTDQSRRVDRVLPPVQLLDLSGAGVENAG